MNNTNDNIDADTNLDDLDNDKLNEVHKSVNNGTTRRDDGNNPSLFGASNVLNKTRDNLESSEAMVDDEPLRTKKTEKLENIEKTDEENNQ